MKDKQQRAQNSATEKVYDVFISYRRENGIYIARNLQQALTLMGVKVFFDMEELMDGRFNEKLYDAIAQSRNAIFLMTAGALDRCSNSGDWVRAELERIVELGVNLVPVAPTGVDVSFPDSLPSSLQQMRHIEVSELNLGKLFNESVNKIAARLKGVTVIDHEERSEAEEVFLSRARRFKVNDGVIDNEEREELDRLADRLGISLVRRESLIERIESEMAQGKPSLRTPKHKKKPLRALKLPEGAPSSGAVTCGDSQAERIRVFCAEERKKASWDELYVGDDIQAQKLANFRSSASRRGSNEKGILLSEPIALCDATVFGSAKNGFLFTADGISVSGDWAALTSVDYITWKEFVESESVVRVEGNYEVLLYSARGRSVFFNAAACGRSVQDVVGFFRRLSEALGAKPVVVPRALPIVAEAFANVRSDRFWIGENIPLAKERNARESMKIGKLAIFALYDDTVWGGSREGFAVTARGLFFKNISEDPEFIPWTGVKTISAAKGALFVGKNKIECSDSSLDLQAKHAVAAGLRLLAKRSADLSEED